MMTNLFTVDTIYLFQRKDSHAPVSKESNLFCRTKRRNPIDSRQLVARGRDKMYNHMYEITWNLAAGVH